MASVQLPNPFRSNLTKKYLLTGIALVALLFYCVQIVESSIGPDSQWDFPVFYFSAKAFFEGGVNPHDRAKVEEYIQWKMSLNGNDYNYGPLTLLLFWPLSRLNDYQTAVNIYLNVRLLLLILLLYFWHREFLRDVNFAFFLAFCIFAFNGAIFIDLKAGNVSIVEQIALWAGFYFYMRRKWLVFSALVILAGPLQFN